MKDSLKSSDETQRMLRAGEDSLVDRGLELGVRFLIEQDRKSIIGNRENLGADITADRMTSAGDSVQLNSHDSSLSLKASGAATTHNSGGGIEA